ncbi:MAG: winged helix-turn-helix transcriptional regulator [Thermoplasmatota archaeon]
MESVVAWLEGHGSLEEEIQKSVASISSLFQKWTFEILFLLRLRGRMRFNQLKEELGGVGPATIGSRVKDLAGVGSRTLSQRLKELEARGLVQREVFPEVPVRVEYSLTDKGLRFGDLIMPSIAFMRLSAIENGEE